MNSGLWIALTPIVLLALLLHYMPLWRRENIWFGVTVPAGFRDTPEAKKILRQYRIRMWTATGIAALLSIVAIAQSMEWLLPTAIIFLTVVSIALFGAARNRTKPYSQPLVRTSAPLSSDTETLPGGPAMWIGPFGILLAAAIYLQANWQRIPARFPVHWGMSGAPDAWGHRSWMSVFGPLIAAALLNIVMLLMGQAILRYSPRARVADTAEWTARFRRVNVRLIVVLTWGLSLMFAWFAILPLLPHGDTFGGSWIGVALLLGSIIPFLWQLIRLSQEPGSGSDGTPDYAWKLGQIYYNPDDPALIVERRFGVGYTLNFGNRASWWLLGLMILPAVVLIVLR